MPDLAFVFLLVSCASLVFQVLAFTRLAARRAHTPVEELVGGGYIRTVACRVLAATIYVVVAGIQLAGAGTLSAEALTVFTSVQSLWICNSLADIRIRRTLGNAGRPGAGLTQGATRQHRRHRRRPRQDPRQAIPGRRRPESHPRANRGEGRAAVMSSPREDDALTAARGLTKALDAMSGQLKAVGDRLSVAEGYIRRSKHIIIALAVSLCLDILITAGLGYNTVRQNDTQNGIRASDIRQCQLANGSRTQDIAIWNRLLNVPAATAAKATAAQKAEFADLKRLVRAKDTPRDCAAAFKK